MAFMATILLVVMLARADTSVTYTCDQCKAVIMPDPFCGGITFYRLTRFEDGGRTCLDYRTPMDLIFCSMDCVRAYVTPKPEPEVKAPRIPQMDGQSFAGCGVPGCLVDHQWLSDGWSVEALK